MQDIFLFRLTEQGIKKIMSPCLEFTFKALGIGCQGEIYIRTDGVHKHIY